MKPPKPNNLPDQHLWDRVKSTVTPLYPKPPKNSGPPKSQHMRVPQEPPRTRASKDLPVQRVEDKKVRRGRVNPDITLDLHDLSQVQARSRLKTQLIRAYNRNIRTVLVITGKGLRMEGVLRRAFPDWMQDPDIRPIIAGFAQAHQRHGGAGAWYVFLKG